ncbi:5-oxoprolinase-like protein [Tanacetum coccineum]|uniref:5-oxoprolinase-like protein n=1 Tax=Tanacetum coccineum TaxID=301880 RepID=A0ABQ5A036_9ASTR
MCSSNTSFSSKDPPSSHHLSHTQEFLPHLLSNHAAVRCNLEGSPLKTRDERCKSLHRVIESFIVSYRNRTYRIIATEFAYWAPNIESMEVNSESNPLERKDAEGPSLDESLENEEHLDVDSCDSDSPKNVNNDSVSPSSRVLREEDVRGVESDLVDSFEEGEIRDDSVLYNDGCIKDCMEKNLEDDAGEILGVHSQGDCGNVTTDDNEDVTPVIAPEKDSIIAPPSTPPGNDLNIAVESGSSWIDYIGPLTSDEIDSDKRWSYRDPNGNIHGLFSLAQLRSWKDYFPSDLQIWSYYGNVKEVILLHNALSRQTKDAGRDMDSKWLKKNAEAYAVGLEKFLVEKYLVYKDEDSCEGELTCVTSKAKGQGKSLVEETTHATTTKGKRFVSQVMLALVTVWQQRWQRKNAKRWTRQSSWKRQREVVNLGTRKDNESSKTGSMAPVLSYG